MISKKGMTFLQSPHLDLATVRIETARCVLVPFSTDGRVNLHELQEEFCKANYNLFIWPKMPSYEQEVDYVDGVARDMKERKIIEFFILQKGTGRLMGCIGLGESEWHLSNLGLWIRTDEHGKWYGTEIYQAMVDWAREHTTYQFLKHAMDARNTGSRKLALKFGGILQDETNTLGDEVYHIPL